MIDCKAASEKYRERNSRKRTANLSRSRPVFVVVDVDDVTDERIDKTNLYLCKLDCVSTTLQPMNDNDEAVHQDDFSSHGV